MERLRKKETLIISWDPQAPTDWSDVAAISDLDGIAQADRQAARGVAATVTAWTQREGQKRHGKEKDESSTPRASFG